MTTGLPENLGFTGVVSGRVQGVGFRYFVARAAHTLGLSGYVRNLPVGTVEVAAAGDRAALESLAALLEEGPPGAVVESVELDWSSPPDVTGSFDGRF